jgi:hypothetical protein
MYVKSVKLKYPSSDGVSFENALASDSFSFKLMPLPLIYLSSSLQGSYASAIYRKLKKRTAYMSKRYNDYYSNGNK